MAPYQTELQLRPTDSGRTSFNYQLLDGSGNAIADAREVEQSGLRKLWRLVDGPGSRTDHKLAVTDRSGALLLSVIRTSSLAKSNGVVVNPDGQQIGELEHAGRYKATEFQLLVGGRVVGAIASSGEGMYDFVVLDQNGSEAGRISRGDSKTWSLALTSTLNEPLSSLVLAGLILLDITIGHLLSASFLP